MGDTHPTPAENTSPTSAALEGREPDPAVLAGDIDSRMAALLKDHQEMGARPAKEPAAEPTTYPLPATPKPEAAKKAKAKK